MKRLQKKDKFLAVGIGLGITYGLLTRLVFGKDANMASMTYLFVIPVVLGVIPLMFTDDEKLRSYRNIIFIPWLTLLGFFLSLFIFGIEDLFCLLILLAPFLFFVTIGAFIFKIVMINRKKKKARLLTLVLLPFIIAPLESYIGNSQETYHVTNEVVIAASPQKIWDNIVEVKTIEKNEYKPGFFNYNGIPRPLNASVDRREKGGQRIGNFEGGLKFVETITGYEPHKKISFDIKIDPETVRKRVFDQHVLKGGYFRFVDATYELTELGNGEVKLALSSSYQLVSTINFYGKFWGDMVLSDFQSRLLNVLEARCEASE